ncbi:methionyl-tRNA formyltransferase [Clostridium algidicarnis]|uniref:Methionyl-tRNA formyltransferase n=2 Tax=Clostridium algidicarnis TaxID=37659 RepID=A0A2S6G168_9CLOT|nr:methionyl-tRNA formyltransferase [Clostridium algidicarnis]MBB6631163.1 methionyl-tRNA formyltransferase [Clostridium algidicarnis]MBU3203195.1 methionyl-tRNA formyltransferase [Clostridium algidicarnis]MBU3211349.1 methionyl-tRNA formyltransferase [Clostridium algidicarnis]MBU3218731.1 methionyl-tRNA formyltransferase [Clostridium algidicarnis]MBU3222143.1 methionyl-tRNA formyltransferase [Clostridium algidicarnis]
MNIVFMGTPNFAVPSFKKIIDEYGVVAVFTQPDRPKGRGKKISMSPVKELALDYNIPVFQPEKVKGNEEVIRILKDLNPDFIIVVAYGQILPKEVLELPKYACINLHASLLPKYRGAAPINWAIINGEKESGNTTMLMDVGLDTGDILLTNKVDIDNEITAGELHDNLMSSGSDLLIETIESMYKGGLKSIKQENMGNSYASMLNKDIAKINWNENSLNIHNLIRGLNPWPIAHTDYEGQRMKIYKSSVINKKSTKTPGTILNVSKEGIEVATKDSILRIEIIQFPNAKPLKVEEYINGHDIKEGLILI